MRVSQNYSNQYNSPHSAKETPNFGARNPEIRRADDICRKVMAEFPLRSNTKISRKYFYRTECTHIVSKFILYYGDMINTIRASMTNLERKHGRDLAKELKMLKAFGCGNCRETTDAGCAAFLINGYENVQRLSLFAVNYNKKEVRCLDHSVVGLNFNFKDKVRPNDFFESVYIRPKGAIVVDPWSGITDYAAQATKKLENSGLGFQLDEGETMVFLPYDTMNVAPNDIAFLKYKYPKLSKEKIYKSRLRKDKTINIPKYRFKLPRINKTELKDFAGIRQNGQNQ